MKMKDYFDDIYKNSGIRIVKTENGGYRWSLDSVTEFRTPMQALLDAQKVIGEEDEGPDLLPVNKPNGWGAISITIKPDIEWSPIIPLR